VRRHARAVVAIGWLLLLPLPFLAFWWAGLLKVGRAHGALIEHGALHDKTSPGVWAALAVVYLVWMVGLAVASIWVFDHLGYHYQPYDRPRRPTRRERRRQRAGLRYQEARQTAQRDALREIAAQSRRAAHETDADDDAGGSGDPGHGAGGSGDRGPKTGPAGHGTGPAGGDDERR